jgi:hypothetical protein
MQATDESPFAFEKAGEALKWVDIRERPDGRSAGGSKPKSSNRPQEKKPRCARVAGACLFGWTHATFRSAHGGIIGRINDAEIHLFSDGAVLELSEFETKRCRWFIIASANSKTSASSLDVRSNPENAKESHLRERRGYSTNSPQTSWNCCWMTS